MSTAPIPEGFHSVTPYLAVPNAARLVDFLCRAFGAVETLPRRPDAEGRIHHTEVRLGSSMLMVGEAPGDAEPQTGMFYLYVEDVDEVYARALAAGGVSRQPPTDQPHGDRMAAVTEASGCQWLIATQLVDRRRQSE